MKINQFIKVPDVILKSPFPQMVLIPFFENASQIVPNCQTYPKHETALAFFIFYHKWTEYFGDRNLCC
jgi:hypothetical protein